MARRHLTTNEIVAIYNLRNNHTPALGVGQIMKKLKLTYLQVDRALRIMDQYLTRYNSIKKKRHSFDQAREAILNSTPVTEVTPAVETKAEPMTDPYNRIFQAFNTFQAEVEQFIEAMVEKKNGQLKQENADLKRALESAKLQNWGEYLRKKYGGS